MRSLPPAAGIASPHSVGLLAIRADGIRAELERGIRSAFGCDELFFTGSGTEALWRVFKALQSAGEGQYVVHGAYTCPDITTAALGAGFRVYLADLHPRTLEPLWETVPDTVRNDTAAVVLTNPYGMIDDVDAARAAFPSHTAIIDDACQAALGKVGKEFRPVGGRFGTVGILSFGRGKAIPGIGGGAILLTSLPRALSSLLREKIGESLRPPGGQAELSREAVQLLQGAAQWLFEHPHLFAIPASIPLLRLGETPCRTEVTTRPFTRTAAAFALAALQFHHQFREVSFRCAGRWCELLSSLSLPAALVLPLSERRSELPTIIRFPILFSKVSERAELFRKLSLSSGVSSSYPSVVSEYRPFRSAFPGRILHGTLTNSRLIAETLCTLPCHRYVEARDARDRAELLGRSFARQEPVYCGAGDTFVPDPPRD